MVVATVVRNCCRSCEVRLHTRCGCPPLRLFDLVHLLVLVEVHSASKGPRHQHTRGSLHMATICCEPCSRPCIKAGDIHCFADSATCCTIPAFISAFISASQHEASQKVLPVAVGSWWCCSSLLPCWLEAQPATAAPLAWRPWRALWAAPHSPATSVLLLQPAAAQPAPAAVSVLLPLQPPAAQPDPAAVSAALPGFCSGGVYSVHIMKTYIDAGLHSAYAMDRCHATKDCAALRWWRASSLTRNRHAMCTEGRSHPAHAATLTLPDLAERASAGCASARCALPASSRDSFSPLPAASWRQGTTSVRGDVQLASYSLQLICR